MKLVVYTVIIIIIIAHLFKKHILKIMHSLTGNSSKAKVIFKDYWGGGEFKAGIVPRMIPISSRIVSGYNITFELENQKSITLIVPKKIYDGLSIGSTGVLEYCFKSFMNFKLDQ